MSASPDPDFDVLQATDSDRGQATRERLLDAAERLFAERGYEGTSLRAVTRAAGASVSAANYHFGSKRSLLRAAVRRHLEALNQRRLALLAAAEERAGARAPRLEDVADAFLRPVFERREESAKALASFELMARVYSESIEDLAALKHELFAELSERFLDAIDRTLPGRDPRELATAFQLGVGALLHVIGGHLEDAPALIQRGAGWRDEELLPRVASYWMAGLRAVPPLTPSRPTRNTG